jgi:hypothetical protein
MEKSSLENALVIFRLSKRLNGFSSDSEDAPQTNLFHVITFLFFLYIINGKLKRKDKVSLEL